MKGTPNEALAWQTQREEPSGKWWLTIYFRCFCNVLSLDAECEISIKVNQGRVTIWALLSAVKDIHASLTNGRLLLTRLLSPSSPLLSHFSLYSRSLSLFLSPFVAPPHSASARHRGGIIIKWLLAGWLNGMVDIFPSVPYTERGKRRWPSRPTYCCIVCAHCAWLLSSHHMPPTSEEHGCCYRLVSDVPVDMSIAIVRLKMGK